ncbi:MAG: TonB-dependent receptor [Bacteroidales bacterium]|nr:TonB-dependent receptor [Bacteroidales bacterium]
MNNKTLIRRAILPSAVICLALTFNPYTAFAVSSPLAVNGAGDVVTGIVLDETGETITGAKVSTSDGGTLAVTDYEGKFEIDVRPGTELQVAYVGYNTVRIVAGDGMEVTLTPDTPDSDRIEMIAYGVRKKAAVTGAVSSMNGDELLKTSVGSVNNLLAGRLPGVTAVQWSGEPGADAAEIFVRGRGTWQNSSPLILVDGVEREMWDIDPNEIESVTVLKDASSTAVYGMRGANGVLLITTRHGREGKARINVSTSFTAVTPTRKIEPASSFEYAGFYNQMCANDGREQAFSDFAIEKFRTNADPVRFPNVNWADYIMKDVALQQQHNVNVSGGSNRVKYFISAGMYAQDGLFKEWGKSYSYDYGYKRFNYRANVDINASKTTLVSASISGKVDGKDTPRAGQGSADMMKAIYCATPFYGPGFVDGRYIVNSASPSDNLSGNWQDQLPFVGKSPMAYYDDQPGGYHCSNNKMSIDLAVTQRLDFITKGLDIKVKGAYNTFYQLLGATTAQVSFYTPVLQQDGNTVIYRKTGDDVAPSYSTSQSAVGRDWYAEASVNYNRTFGGHTVTGLLLYNQAKEYYPSAYSDIPYTYFGLAGRVSYDYKNRYMAEFSIGYNGSGNFAPERRYGTFPAGSLGWAISNEPFFKPLKSVVSLLKLRASWGVTGNDNFRAVRSMYFADTYGASHSALLESGALSYNFGVQSGTLSPGVTGEAADSPLVGWEKAYGQNYGLDLNFLDDRLSISFDWYREHRTDILIPAYDAAPAIEGGLAPVFNSAEANRRGWEISLNWSDKVGKDFRYWAGLNVSNNRNEIAGEGDRIGSRPLYKFWKFYYEDCEADYEKAFNSPFPTQLTGDLEPGDCVYVDLDKNGKIDSGDKVCGLGHTDDPEYFGGLNLGLQYKGLSFSTQLTGAWNVSRLIGGVYREPFASVESASAADGGLLSYHLNHTWTADNPSQSAEFPRATWSNATQNYADCSLYEKDAKYLRVKAVRLGYDFSFPFMKKIGLSQLQLALSAYNLFTFTPYVWGDPEALAGSSVSYPLQRTFTASLKVGF